MTGWIQRGLVVLATVAMLAVNTLASTVGINGLRTGEIANRYDLPFTPAGWVFSIWSLIYIGLLAFTVFQVAGQGSRSARVAALRPIYVFSAAANGAWLWFWHHEALPASLLVMLLLLVALLAMRRVLSVEPPASAGETWCVDAPFRLYFAWITLATLANLSVVATSGVIPGLQPDATYWSQAMVAASLAVAVFAYARRREPVWLGVIAWAMAGVALKAGQDISVSAPAIVVAALAGLGCLDLLLVATRPRDGQSTIA